MKDLSALPPRERSVTISALLAIGLLAHETKSNPESTSMRVIERVLACLVHGATEVLDATVEETIAIAAASSQQFMMMDMLKAIMPPDVFEMLRNKMLNAARDAGLTTPDDEEDSNPFSSFINGLDM